MLTAAFASEPALAAHRPHPLGLAPRLQRGDLAHMPGQFVTIHRIRITVPDRRTDGDRVRWIGWSHHVPPVIGTVNGGEVG